MDKNHVLQQLRGKRICVLVGGPSGEAEISRRSGDRVHKSLLKMGLDAFVMELEPDFVQRLRQEHVDLVCVMLHGTPGEDGSVQAALELAGIAYTGSDHFSSVLAMDKLLSKWAFVANGLPTPDFAFPRTGESLEDFAISASRELGTPCVLKPRREGSSLGVVIAHTKQEIAPGLQQLKPWFPKIIAERFIKGKTVTCGVLGTGSQAFAVPVLELRVKQREFYDYTAKYTPGQTEFVIPAQLAQPVYEKVQRLAVAAHNLLGCKGFSRVDFVIADGEAYILEVNTIPGMTELSDLPAEAAAGGIDYDTLVLHIMASGLQ